MNDQTRGHQPHVVDQAVTAAAARLGPAAEFRPCDLAAAAGYSLGRVAASIARLAGVGVVEFCRVAPGGCLYRLAVRPTAVAGTGVPVA